MKIKANELFKQGMELLNKGNIAEAENIANSLTMTYPDHPGCLGLYAGVLAKKGHYGASKSILQQAIALDNKEPQLWNNLGYACRFLGQVEEAIECYKQAIKRDDSDATVYSNLAAMYVAQGQDAEAEGIKYCEEAIKRNPEEYGAINNKSILLLQQGKYREGFAIYDSRMKAENRPEKHYPRNTPMWDGSKGKTVVVHGEQAIGDEIMFASMLEDAARDCRLIFECHDRLAGIFKASFPDFEVYGTKRKKTQEKGWISRYHIDAKIPIASLAKFYRNSLTDFPRKSYLKAPEWAIEQASKRLPSGKCIGISWQGGRVDTYRNIRSIPLDKFLPLFKTGAHIISLQYDKDAYKEVEAFNKEHNVNLIHINDILTSEDYSETAGLVSCLERVISVPQSVVHLAGSLGVPTVQLTPYKAMWQMGVYGKDLPWYGSVRSIWQNTDGKWDSVLEQAFKGIINVDNGKLQAA